MSTKAVRILVVDDDILILDYLQQFLKIQGWTVFTTDNGENALSQLRKDNFDILVLDIYLQDMNGIHLLNALSDKIKEIDVIMLTGYGTVPLAVEAIQKGAAAFLEKPSGLDDIVPTIKKLLDERRLPKHVLAERMDQFIIDNVSNKDLKMKVLLEKFHVSESYVLNSFEKRMG